MARVSSFQGENPDLLTTVARRRRLLAVASLSVGTLLLIGCGGGNSDNSTGSTSDAMTDTSAPTSGSEPVQDDKVEDVDLCKLMPASKVQEVVGYEVTAEPGDAAKGGGCTYAPVDPGAGPAYTIFLSLLSGYINPDPASVREVGLGIVKEILGGTPEPTITPNGAPAQIVVSPEDRILFGAGVIGTSDTRSVLIQSGGRGSTNDPNILILLDEVLALI